MHADRPSSTALNIGLSTVLVGQDRALSALVPAHDFALVRDALLGCGRRTALLVHALERVRLFQWVCRALERRLLAGFHVHVALRKRAIEQLVCSGLRRGCRQVVVIGAGLDPLAMRLARHHPESTFIEIDHPATQAIKRRVCSCADAPTNCVFRAADLSECSLDRALQEGAGFDATRPTVFVVEGVLMYLDEHLVWSLMRAIAALPCPAKGLVFTYMEARSRRGVGFANQSRVIDWWLARAREPMRWAVEPADLGALLRLHGWCLSGSIRAPQLLELLLRTCPGSTAVPATGESVAWAMLDRPGVEASILPDGAEFVPCALPS